MNAVSLFKQGGFANILKGVEEVGTIVHELPHSLEECENVKDDLTKLKQWASVFAHPITLAENIATNLFQNYN
jgi:hypothetical protein